MIFCDQTKLVGVMRGVAKECSSKRVCVETSADLDLSGEVFEMRGFEIVFEFGESGKVMSYEGPSLEIGVFDGSDETTMVQVVQVVVEPVVRRCGQDGCVRCQGCGR